MGFLRKGDVNVSIAAQDKTASAFKSAEKRMKLFSGQAKMLVGGLGAALGARMLQRQVMGAIEYGSALTDAATATQTNIEALQVLRAAARDAGAEQAKLDQALIRAQKAGVDAANGLSTYTRAFDALNIDVAEFNRLPTEKKLESIAQGMKSAEDKQAAYAAAMDILGTRNAPKLMEVLQRLGTEGYGALSEEIKKTNSIMSEGTAQQLDETADAMNRLKDAMTVKTGKAAAGILHVLKSLREGLIDWKDFVVSPREIAGFWGNQAVKGTRLLNKGNVPNWQASAVDRLNRRAPGTTKSVAPIAEENPMDTSYNNALHKMISEGQTDRYGAVDMAGGERYGLADSKGWVKISRAMYDAILEDQRLKQQMVNAIERGNSQIRNGRF